jgi:hypothetical protein
MPNPTNRPPWRNHGICKTNPVYAVLKLVEYLEPEFADDLILETGKPHKEVAAFVRSLSENGTRLPSFALDGLISQGALPTDYPAEPGEIRPGVMGLVVHRRHPTGLVVPLAPQSGEWRTEPRLPFGSEEIQNRLVRLLHATGLRHLGVVPERSGFVFENPLGEWVTGDSMTLAAVLAILDALGKQQHKLLRAACILTELSPGGDLGPVDEVDVKVAAAIRECGPLSLVICHRDTPIQDWFDDAQLGELWPVGSFSELAERLYESRILTPMLRSAPLTRPEAKRVRDRIRWQVEQTHDYAGAADLGDRLQTCGGEAPIEPGVWAEIGSFRAEASRHQGRFADATALGHDILERARAQGVLASEDEEADAAAEYAAALYDGHRFEEIPRVLQDFADIVVARPRSFRALTRVKVWNTLGRALVVLGRGNWEDLLRRSLELNTGLRDQGEVARTTGYLVYGLCWHGRADEALRELDTAGMLSDSPMSVWQGFAVAKAYLAAGREWHDSDLDAASPETHKPKHAFGLYLQATARQTGRCPSAAADRFRRAAAFMSAEAGDSKGNICSFFAHALDMGAAAQEDDSAGWLRGTQALRAFLASPNAGPLQDYYRPGLDQLGSSPDASQAESFLRTIPYF